MDCPQQSCTWNHFVYNDSQKGLCKYSVQVMEDSLTIAASAQGDVVVGPCNVPSHLSPDGGCIIRPMRKVKILLSETALLSW